MVKEKLKDLSIEQLKKRGVGVGLSLLNGILVKKIQHLL